MKSRNQPHFRNQNGFTLVELVMVIILLGVLASATTQFLVIGVNTYKDIAGRFALIDNARFAIERLNRELRNALPNSVRTTNGNTCIEFVPIRASGTYIDLPIAPGLANNSGTIVTPTNYSWQAGDKLALYVTTPQDAYGSSTKVFAFNSITDLGANSASLSFNSLVQYSDPSPNQRFYITNTDTRWCVQGNTLVRSQPATGTKILMAQGIEQNGLPPFSVTPPNLSRNSLTILELRFINSDEQVIFHNEIQTPNQP